MSSQKHEILFGRFGINYNELPDRFKKGSVLVREEVRTSATGSDTFADTPAPQITGEPASQVTPDGPPSGPAPARDKGSAKKARVRTAVTLYHCDIIGDEFWDARPNILGE